MPARLARIAHPQTPQGDLDMAVAVTRVLAAPGEHVDEDDVREFVDKEAAHHVNGLRGQKAQSRQVSATWHGGQLAEIVAPTLVLHGEGDPLVRPSAARAIAAAYPVPTCEACPAWGASSPATPGSPTPTRCARWPTAPARSTRPYTADGELSRRWRAASCRWPPRRRSSTRPCRRRRGQTGVPGDLGDHHDVHPGPGENHQGRVPRECGVARRPRYCLV